MPGVSTPAPSNGWNLPAAAYGLIELIAPWNASFMGAIAAIFSLDSQKSASRLSARTIALGNARWSPCISPPT